MNKKTISVFSICSALGVLGLLFQNFTTVDFTAPENTKKSPPTALEKAILKSEKENSVRKKKLGVDDRQIHKTYLKRQRKPSTVGDLPLSEVEKDKIKKPRLKRSKTSSKTQVRPAEKSASSSSAQ